MLIRQISLRQKLIFSSNLGLATKASACLMLESEGAVPRPGWRRHQKYTLASTIVIQWLSAAESVFQNIVLSMRTHEICPALSRASLISSYSLLTALIM